MVRPITPPTYSIIGWLCAVFVLDTGLHVFVWVGKEATSHEKGGGLIIAHVSLRVSQLSGVLNSVCSFCRSM